MNKYTLVYFRNRREPIWHAESFHTVKAARERRDLLLAYDDYISRDSFELHRKDLPVDMAW